MAQTREPLDLPDTDEFGDLARLLR